MCRRVHFSFYIFNFFLFTFFILEKCAMMAKIPLHQTGQQNILSFLHNFLLYTWIINSWSMNNSLISRHCNVSLSILSFLLNLFHGLYNYILPLIDNFKLSLLHENFIRIERKWVRMRAIKPILLLIPLDLSLPIILKNHLLSLLYHWILNQHKRIPLNPDKFLWNRL